MFANIYIFGNRGYAGYRVSNSQATETKPPIFSSIYFGFNLFFHTGLTKWCLFNNNLSFSFKKFRKSGIKCGLLNAVFQSSILFYTTQSLFSWAFELNSNVDIGVLGACMFRTVQKYCLVQETKKQQSSWVVFISLLF